MHYLTLRIPSHFQLTDDELYDLCVANRELKIEKNAHGEIFVISPTGAETGNLNSSLNAILWNWNQKHQRSAARLGKTFDSSTGFRLNNGAMRSPDAAWVTNKHWEALSVTERKKFAPLCPDFVIELLSESDKREELQEKMNEWIANGCRLGWLIDPGRKQVYIYKPQQNNPMVQPFSEKLKGGKALPGFEVDLQQILL